MPSIPNRPNIPGGGWRQQQAAQLRAQSEVQERTRNAGAPDQVGLGEDRIHRVQEGDTIDSLAERYDCSPESIRNHPNNAGLAAHEDDHATLSEGDNVYIPSEDERSPQPVGQGERVVKHGECISSIAKDTGHFWETIWNDPANEELKGVRENPNILLPGDRVTIPEKRRKEAPRETELRHRFVRRGEPTMLRVRILEHDKPRANEAYLIKIGSDEIRGTTDPDGKIQCLLSASERHAELIVGEGKRRRRYTLNLGRLDPLEAPMGVQQRLANLGFYFGRIDGNLGDKSRRAICAFQEKFHVSETGRPDSGTLARLKEVHGS